MASLDFTNLLGAVTNITTATYDEFKLKDFLSHIDDYGVQVKSKYEVNFSGLQDITYRIQDIKLPLVKANTTQLHYDGRSIPILINYDYDHDFSMTVLNDAQGYVYSTLVDLIMSDASSSLASGGYTMTIKAQTGDSKYKGALITCTGVRITSVDGLDFGQSANDALTFSVNGTMLEYSVTPGTASTAANIIGAVNSLIS